MFFFPSSSLSLYCGLASVDPKMNFWGVVLGTDVEYPLVFGIFFSSGVLEVEVVVTGLPSLPILTGSVLTGACLPAIDLGK